MSKNKELEGVILRESELGITADFVREKSTMGGVVAQRGFIFQTIIALIECLERDDWDQVKLEPKTIDDKVDIQLYKDGLILKAIQVKSSQRAFERSHVETWLNAIKNDASDAKEVSLYLVGDLFTPTCKAFIESASEVKVFPFFSLESECKSKLQGYVNTKGRGDLIGDEDLQSAYNNLFAEIHTNSISSSPFSREDFEKWLQRVLSFSKCLTIIPAVNREVGLVGREQELHELREMLDKDGCIALISGLGGIGKTAIMRWICNMIKEDGITNNHVAWITCGASLKDDLLLLRDSLGITTTENIEEDYKLVVDKLRNFKGTLYLFMDNLSRALDVSEINMLNSLQPAVRIMITARHKIEDFSCKNLDNLSADAACEMFYNYYGRDISHKYIDSVLIIVNTVRCHTLLVELLARAAAKSGGTLEDFNTDLQEKGFFDLFKRPINTKHDAYLSIEESIIKLYEISELPEEQQRILKLFSIFTPEREIYYKISDWAELDMNAMDELVDSAWLERGGLENGYFIHQIIKDSISRQVGNGLKIESYGKLLEKVNDIESYMPQNLVYTKTRARLSVVEDITQHLERRFLNQLPDDSPMLQMNQLATVAAFCKNIATVYRNLGDYKKALGFYEVALEIKESIYPANHLAISTTCNEMGVLYSSMGNYEKALESFKRALKIDETLLAPKAPGIAVILNNIAGVYQDWGDHEQALHYYKQALDIQENNPDTNPIDTASTYNNIGGAFYEKGDSKNALRYMEKALSLRESLFGSEHPSTAKTYSNLAEIFRSLGEFNKALEFNEKALCIYIRLLGPQHPFIAWIYSTEGNIYASLDNYTMALEYYKKAIDISEEVLDKQHSHLAVLYSNIAFAYAHLGDSEAAIDYYEKAVYINKLNFGSMHWRLATIYSSMSLIYSNQGNHEKAMNYLNQALEIIEKRQEVNYSDDVYTYNNIGMVYHNEGCNESAIQSYKKALMVAKEASEEDKRITATINSNIAKVYKDQKLYSKALEYFQESLRIVESLSSGEDSMRATIYENIADIELFRENYVRALEYCKKAVDIRQEQLGISHPLTQTDKAYEYILNWCIKHDSRKDN